MHGRDAQRSLQQSDLYPPLFLQQFISVLPVPLDKRCTRSSSGRLHYRCLKVDSFRVEVEMTVEQHVDVFSGETLLQFIFSSS